MKWTILSSEYLYQDTWLRARKDRCLRPDGKIVEPYYVMEYPTWVTAMALTKNNEVVLVRQYRHALGEVCLETPGGCVDATDRSFEEAARRELLEETGYSFGRGSYLGITSANPSTNNNLMHMFLLQDGEKVQGQQLDHNEDIEVVLMPLNELFPAMLEGRFLQSMHMTALMLGLHRLGKITVP